MESSAREVMPEGRLFGGRWRIVGCIRAGGMGTVYEVVHRETQARSALKVMLPELVTSEELRARFRQEAMVTATIESDHIVKVFDGGTDVETGAPYLVMELLRGEDLAARVAARGPLPAEEVVTLLRQTALALDRTHAAGVVHRDLKPENLFLTARDDGSPRVKVLDFGIAKIIASASKAETTRTVGTPLYMAPEQVKGDATIGTQADLYAVGHIAFTLLVGRPYWTPERSEHGSVYPLLMAITAGAKEPARERAGSAGAGLPEAFDAWFARATAVAPMERFASAGDMIDALARALGVVEPRAATLATADAAAPPDAARLAASAPPAPRAHSVVGVSRDAAASARSSRALTIAAGIALAAGVTALSWWLRDRPPQGSTSAADTAAATSGASASVPVTSVPVASEPIASVPVARPPIASVPVASPHASVPVASATSPAAGRPAPKAPPAVTGTAAAPAPPPAPTPRGVSDPSDVYRGEKRP